MLSNPPPSNQHLMHKNKCLSLDFIVTSYFTSKYGYLKERQGEPNDGNDVTLLGSCFKKKSINNNTQKINRASTVGPWHHS